MKRVINKVRLMAITAGSFLTISSTEAAFAGDKKENPIELRYLGNKEKNPQFLLSLNNAETDVFFIQITDADNTVIFTERVKGALVSRTYRLDMEQLALSEANLTGIMVEVISKKTHETLVFKVDRNTRTTEDVIITKF